MSKRMSMPAAFLLMNLSIPGANAEPNTIPPVLILTGSEGHESFGEPFLGESYLYIWFFNYSLARLTFGLEGSFEILELLPEPGWTNVGTLTSPQLVAESECAPDGIVARVLVRDATGAGGRLCFIESALDSRLCVDSCAGDWRTIDEVEGFRTDGGPACYGTYSSECRPFAVESRGWGTIKARYR